MKELFEGKKWVVVDAECLRDVKPPFGFDRSEFLGNAVTCSVDQDGNVRDWVGNESIFGFWKYLLGFDYVISFNGLGFDYPLWGGCLLTPEDFRARTIFKDSFKGKTIDLCLDFYKALGVRVGLNAVSIPTLGDVKEMQGGFAPQLWREGKRFEVINYCRGDIRRTRDLFIKAINGEDLSVQVKGTNQIRTFKTGIEVR